jgi:hypothetical protein
MTPREKYLERQRRYNASEKGLARHRRYNRSDKGLARNDRGNALRIFVGSLYAGRVGAPEVATEINEHARRRLVDFKTKQREEYAEFLGAEGLK